MGLTQQDIPIHSVQIGMIRMACGFQRSDLMFVLHGSADPGRSIAVNFRIIRMENTNDSGSTTGENPDGN